jgi:CubicO group peptidase (beta-lactamase class C family)
MVGLRDGTATEAGLSARRLDHARDLAAEWVADGMHPAITVLVARRGVIALHEAFGRLGPEPDDPALTTDALFPLASLGKPLTATALMQLVEDGRVGLTRRVCDYIPEFNGDGKDAVYVHHLLTHTSGLRWFTGIEDLGADLMARLAQPPSDASLHPVVDAFLQMAYENPLETEPGKYMYYDTLNYDLLGEIVRRVSGHSLRTVIHERIFEPIGMSNSQVTVPPELVGEVVRATPESPGSMVTWGLRLLDGAIGGGAGMFATARDMATFGQAFLDGGIGINGRFLASSTVSEMTRNQIPGIPGGLLEERHDEASWSYGWGIACHEKWSYFPTHPPGTLNHGGASGVYLWCDPTHEMVGAFFAATTKDLEPDLWMWQADLFVNAVTAAIED